MTKVTVSGFDTVKVKTNGQYVEIRAHGKWLTMTLSETQALRNALNLKIQQVLSRG